MIDKNINNILCVVEEIHDSKKNLYEFLINVMYIIKNEIDIK